ncbi:AraC family transcriptional regulator [Nocardioides sp. NPDC127514]|uniref:helix-turn-helix domain-containing protein n=1 Tax=unclassified Nocardioides TaxID=2615069 RepID=UPI0033193A4D
MPKVGFQPPAGTPVGMEVLTLADFRDRTRDWPWHIATPHRQDFHTLMLVTAGTLTHRVDFTGYVLPPGSWLWIRPGQVHQWQNHDQAEAILIFFREDFVAPETAELTGLGTSITPMPLYRPEPSGIPVLAAAAEQLIVEFSQWGHHPLPVHTALLHRLLDVILLRLANLQQQGQAAESAPEPFLRFRDAVERGFTRTHRIDDYARELGYSTRTLTRATQTGAGVSAKDYLDQRLVLEAKRLLAHGTEPASTIAAHLGFTSATHFGKFFQRHTGHTPLAFRATQRVSPPA